MVWPSGISLRVTSTRTLRRMADTDELATLRADARYAQERFHLYRAKSYGMHATRPERLRELERRANETLERLRFAEREAAAD